MICIFKRIDVLVTKSQSCVCIEQGTRNKCYCFHIIKDFFNLKSDRFKEVKCNGLIACTGQSFWFLFVLDSFFLVLRMKGFFQGMEFLISSLQKELLLLHCKTCHIIVPNVSPLVHRSLWPMETLILSLSKYSDADHNTVDVRIPFESHILSRVCVLIFILVLFFFVYRFL